MTVRPIARLGHPHLRKQARTVLAHELGTPGLLALVDDMIETMRDASGAGLAAPQILDERRVVVIEVKENKRYPQFSPIELRVLVNPRLEVLVPPELASVQIYEGCLSMPGLRGRVTRPARVQLNAQGLDGAPIDEIWEGVAAAILQHEVDHLEGVLFVDRAEPRSLTYLEEFDEFVPASARVRVRNRGEDTSSS